MNAQHPARVAIAKFLGPIRRNAKLGLFSVVVIALLLPRCWAQLIAYDNFSGYSAGFLDTQSGGFGWTSAWSG